VPELTVVLDHLGGPPVGSGEDGPWVAAIRRLAALPNVTCKLSGAHTTPARASDLRHYYETVLAAFGPDRLMFGSDWPVSTLAASLGGRPAPFRAGTQHPRIEQHRGLPGRRRRRRRGDRRRGAIRRGRENVPGDPGLPPGAGLCPRDERRRLCHVRHHRTAR